MFFPAYPYPPWRRYYRRKKSKKPAMQKRLKQVRAAVRKVAGPGAARAVTLKDVKRKNSTITIQDQTKRRRKPRFIKRQVDVKPLDQIMKDIGPNYEQQRLAVLRAIRDEIYQAEPEYYPDRVVPDAIVFAAAENHPTWLAFQRSQKKRRIE